METGARAVGRIGDRGSWIGFAPSGDGYRLVRGTEGGAVRRLPGEVDDLVTLAIAYFAEALDDPPDQLAATHGDMAALVRRLAETEPDATRRAELGLAVDAIDDGYAADAVIARLTAVLPPSAGDDPVARLVERARNV